MRKPSKILDKLEVKIQEIDSEIKAQEKVVKKESAKLDRLVNTRSKSQHKRVLAQMKDKDESTISKPPPSIDDGYTDASPMDSEAT